MREMVRVVARDAVAVGVAGLFMETHPDPSVAMSDGPNAVPLTHIPSFLHTFFSFALFTPPSPFFFNYFSFTSSHPPLFSFSSSLLSLPSHLSLSHLS